MTHHDLICTIIRLVRGVGAAGALDELRVSRPRLMSGAYHDTIAVFSVWAVERLVDAGLSDTAVLWHPLTDSRSSLAWYDAATLASAEAAERFVPSPLALPGEAAPVEPGRLVAV